MIINYSKASTTEQNLGLRHDDLKPAFDASVDQTDARIAKVTGIVWVRPPVCRAGPECRPANGGDPGSCLPGQSCLASAVGHLDASGVAPRIVTRRARGWDFRWLAAASHVDREILLWDLAAGRERERLRGHESRVICLAFAPDGRSLASGGKSDPAIILWDLATGRPRCRLAVPPPGLVPCLAYSPDGRWLAATGHPDRPVRLWDLEGRRGERLFETHSRAGDPVAFSSDGRMLATTGADGAVRVWDVETGRELHRLGGPRDRLTGVAFSPDGRLLAATGTDADIRLWDLAEILVARPSRER